MGRPYKDISGEVFGNLKVIGKNFKRKNKTLYWDLKCLVCGNICYAQSSDLKRGRVNYCSKCNNKKSKLMPYRNLYENYKRGAKNRNLEWALNFELFYTLIKSKCNYCGYPPKQILWKGGWKNKAIYNGLDRVDNKKGYTKSNTVTCCKFCNFAKNNLNVEEFLSWLKFIRGK